MSVEYTIGGKRVNESEASSIAQPEPASRAKQEYMIAFLPLSNIRMSTVILNGWAAVGWSVLQISDGYALLSKPIALRVRLWRFFSRTIGAYWPGLTR